MENIGFISSVISTILWIVVVFILLIDKKKKQ